MPLNMGNPNPVVWEDRANIRGDSTIPRHCRGEDHPQIWTQTRREPKGYEGRKLALGPGTVDGE
jgi:hypothetical protein